MSSLKLTLAGVEDINESSSLVSLRKQPKFSLGKVLKILQDFLQPHSKLEVSKAGQDLVAMIPEKDKNQQLFELGDAYIELAEQIPYHHPSQLKLARLVELTSRATRVRTQGTTNDAEYTVAYSRFSLSLRDNRTSGPDDEDPMPYVNFNAFCANLAECHAWESDPTYAIWAMRDAFENEPDGDCRHDYVVLAAAQWILWYGQSLFKQVMWYGKAELDENTNMWKAGPLYEGNDHLDLPRWEFWEKGFREAASKAEYDDECRQGAQRASDLMLVISKSLSF